MSASVVDKGGAAETCTLPVTGMTCAACAARIEKNLRRVEGVRDANVNFATGRATVAFDPAATSQDALVGVVEDSGYGVPAEALRALNPPAAGPNGSPIIGGGGGRGSSLLR